MKKAIYFILISTISISVFTQNIDTGNKLHADVNMVLNVKQFSQFVKRFNYEEDFTGKKIEKEFSSGFSRAEYIKLLFNSSDDRIGSEGNPTKYDSLIYTFISKTINDSLIIDRLSENIYAFTACKVKYLGQIRTLYLILKTEKIKKGYRWALYDAHADFFPVEDEVIKIIKEAKYPDILKFIPPTSNEVNFSHLRKVFEDKDNLTLYVMKEGAGNGLNIMIHMVQTGELEFMYVEKLSYFIFDIPGWVIEVKEFIRDTENSGWLINNIAEWNKDSKLYMQNLLSVLRDEHKY